MKWRIEIFTAKLEAIAKRDRLEEEKAVEFRSLTADLFVDVLSQYERINGRSHPRASNPADLSILRLIDLVPNLDQKHFLAIIPPSIGKDYWLEPFSEVIPTISMLLICFLISFGRLFNIETNPHFRAKSG